MINKLKYISSKIADKLQTKITVCPRRSLSNEKYINEILRDKSNCLNKKLILSIDDISLKGKTLTTSDNGGDYPSYLYSSLNELIKIGFKPTMFFIAEPKYGYIADSSYENKQSFSIAKIDEKPELFNYLRNLCEKNKIEVAQHGLTHHNSKLHGHHSFEFDGIGSQEIKNKILYGKKILSDAFVIRGFKPPAWSTGQLLDTQQEFIDVLKDIKYDYVSLSSPTNGLNYSSFQVSHIHKVEFEGMTHIPQNINILWTKDIIEKTIKAISEKGGIINVQIHFQKANKFLKDGIDLIILEKLKWLYDLSIKLGYEPELSKDI